MEHRLYVVAAPSASNQTSSGIVTKSEARGSAALLTATARVNGEGQNLTPYRMEIPEPIAKKFGTVDYVRKATPCAKFRANPSTGGFSANA